MKAKGQDLVQLPQRDRGAPKMKAWTWLVSEDKSTNGKCALLCGVMAAVAAN